MIVLDEQLSHSLVRQAIERWYKGSVIGVKELRPRTRVLDDVVPALLQRVKAPTFVTINHKDFWKKIPASDAYSVICLKLPADRVLEAPGMLHGVLSREEFRTKRGRMGKVILVSENVIRSYKRAS